MGFRFFFGLEKIMHDLIMLPQSVQDTFAMLQNDIPLLMASVWVVLSFVVTTWFLIRHIQKGAKTF